MFLLVYLCSIQLVVPVVLVMVMFDGPMIGYVHTQRLEKFNVFIHFIVFLHCKSVIKTANDGTATQISFLKLSDRV